MTLDEAIKHAEEVAEDKERNAGWFYDKESSRYKKKCIKCAEEHRQLAEWLKDYKRLLEQVSVLDKIRERIELEKLGYPPSAGYYKAIMKCLQIIDKYKAESEDKE